MPGLKNKTVRAHHFRRGRREPMRIAVRFREEARRTAAADLAAAPRIPPVNGTTLSSATSAAGADAGQEPIVTDLHLRGAFVHADTLPEVGQTLEMTLDTSAQWNPVSVRAEVRWVHAGDRRRPSGFGVEFTQVDEQAAVALYRLLLANRYRD